MNTSLHKDFDVLNEFGQYCAKQGISWSLHYEEPTDSWYISTRSPSPQERIITRNYSRIAMCVDVAKRLLNEIKQ